LSGVDDIESYICEKEQEYNEEYLKVVGLSLSERSQVIYELSAKGVTAGSLFPGIDGICEAQREFIFLLDKTLTIGLG
jgi:hypothetical protein